MNREDDRVRADHHRVGGVSLVRVSDWNGGALRRPEEGKRRHLRVAGAPPQLDEPANDLLKRACGVAFAPDAFPLVVVQQRACGEHLLELTVIELSKEPASTDADEESGRVERRRHCLRRRALAMPSVKAFSFAGSRGVKASPAQRLRGKGRRAHR